MRKTTKSFFHGIICLGFLLPSFLTSYLFLAPQVCRPYHHFRHQILPPPLLVALSMASLTKMHPATLVTNIKTSMPIQLHEDGSNFHIWVTLFKLHCRTHLVDSHILPDDSSKALVSKDSEWQRHDDIVRTWILISNKYIVRSDDCAFDAWNRLENNFQNNKSRILHLES